MVIVGILSWWYGRGLSEQFSKLRAKLLANFDYFSIDLLARTLFLPFRQIDAGKVRGPLAVQMRAFFDQLFSRVIGAVVRTIIMVIGIVWLAVISVLGVVRMVGWLILPIFPIIGIMLWLGGYLPWHR